MPYVKPGTNISQTGPAQSSDSDYLAVDGVSVTFGTAVQASNAGFGVVDPNTGTFEVLDALPLGRQSTQLSIEAGSDIDFASNVDFLTAGEIAASTGKIKEGAGSDLT